MTALWSVSHLSTEFLWGSLTLSARRAVKVSWSFCHGKRNQGFAPCINQPPRERVWPWARKIFPAKDAASSIPRMNRGSHSADRKQGESTIVLAVSHVGGSAAQEGCHRAFYSFRPLSCSLIYTQKPAVKWFSHRVLAEPKRAPKMIVTSLPLLQPNPQSRGTLLFLSPLGASYHCRVASSARLFSPRTDAIKRKTQIKQNQSVFLSRPPHLSGQGTRGKLFIQLSETYRNRRKA